MDIDKIVAAASGQQAAEAGTLKKRKGAAGQELLALPAPADAPAEAPAGATKVEATAAGGGGGGKKEFSDIKKIVSILCKLTLANSFNIRMLKAISVQTVIIPAECQWIKNVKQATEKYKKLAADIAKEDRFDRLALPHVHAWNAIVTTSIEKAKQLAKQDLVTDLERYTGEAQANGGLHCYLQGVKVMKLAKAFDKEKTKIEIAILDTAPDAKVWAAAVDLMKADGGRLLKGTAPPGQMEGLLQTYLDKH